MWAQEALIMVKVPSFPLQSSAVLSFEHHPPAPSPSSLSPQSTASLTFQGNLPPIEHLASASEAARQRLSIWKL